MFYSNTSNNRMTKSDCRFGYEEFFSLVEGVSQSTAKQTQGRSKEVNKKEQVNKKNGKTL